MELRELEERTWKTSTRSGREVGARPGDLALVLTRSEVPRPLRFGLRLPIPCGHKAQKFYDIPLIDKRQEASDSRDGCLVYEFRDLVAQPPSMGRPRQAGFHSSMLCVQETLVYT